MIELIHKRKIKISTFALSKITAPHNDNVIQHNLKICILHRFTLRSLHKEFTRAFYNMNDFMNPLNTIKGSNFYFEFIILLRIFTLNNDFTNS